jgi:hypothetical protein
MNYRGTDYGLRSMSECEGHLFLPLLRDLVSTGSLRKDMIAQVLRRSALSRRVSVWSWSQSFLAR